MTGETVETAVPGERLIALNDQLLAVPAGFTPNPKLMRQLERRRGAMGPEGGIDWGHAEALALASLLTEGVPIRLTGQDTERGTFSHRHLVLHDAVNGATVSPIQRLPGALAAFEVWNSPLSELATLGFEYGYATAASETLVLWEAQYGDFINGAQVIVDQFMAAGLAKWGVTNRLTLLLPHGYEGRDRSTPVPGWSASSSSQRRETSGWPTAPRRRSTSICSAGRPSGTGSGRWWCSRPRACSGCPRRAPI